jgi:hypothetical protein
MNLPTLIKSIYGVITFTGLYSFEFVDRNRNTITEIFFMMPPKGKTVSESTRAIVMPTLGGDYVNDIGNAYKTISLSGQLWFNYVGSPDNPLAVNAVGLDNTIDGLNEFFKLRWMLIRYRDYTMTRYATVDIPVTVLNQSRETTALYKRVSRLVNDGVGALYNEVKLIFHDYDMDDHFYCKVSKFDSSQDDSNFVAINYNIELETYEKDVQQESTTQKVKKETNDSVDSINIQLQDVTYEETFDNIQAVITSNIDFVSSYSAISNLLTTIAAENDLIQAGKKTASENMPELISTLILDIDNFLELFINAYLSESQRTDYINGDLALDEVVGKDLMFFYNSLQNLRLQAISMNGVLKTIPKQDDIRYYADANDYKLTTEQFETGEGARVENVTTFYYYTVSEGDDARTIAQRELNDHEKFVSILRINNIGENDFIDGTLVGKKIKIPFPVSALSRGKENLVYSPDFNDLDSFLYGVDIALNKNKEIMISATGDILTTKGIENAYKNVENRINNRKNTLNVFNPGWGTIAIDEGNVPLMVKIDRYLSDLLLQIKSDPRVEAVEMDLSSLKFDGESISVSTKVFFIGTGESREVSI